ncbi:type II secretion system F family protein [Helicobacter burdigaliensis]|uniref:type II secretion system F family protein n=1 Tax=Helicobacter burdigaliensis TaxID=2315334 RepID=UPI000EF69AE5|nr:type II secretion system F family protein [Helicobacter burdigaliensis]
MQKYEILYKYKGKKFRTQRSAKNKEEIENWLVSNHFIALKITPKESFLSFSKNPSTKDILDAFYQLNLCLRAKIALEISLQSIIEHTKNQKLQQRFLSILFKIKEGKNLSSAFRETGFESFICALIEVGEQNGKIEEMLSYAILSLKLQNKNKKALFRALFYPFFVVIIMLLVFLGIVIFVLPEFENLFMDLGANLPTATLSLLFIKSLVIDYGFFSFVCMMGAFLLFKGAYLKIEKFANFIDFYMLKIPIFGEMIYYSQIHTFFVLFYYLTQSEVPIKKRLECASGAISNKYLKKRLEIVYLEIEKGISLSLAFKKAQVLNLQAQSLLHSIRDGKGLLSALSIINELYGEILEDKTSVVIASLEPLAILFLGVLVLWLGLGIFLPLWELPMQLKNF